MSRSFSSTASDVWDKLPVHVSSASTLPVFSRQTPFIPSCLSSIHYTDHQSWNLLQYHFVYLYRVPAQRLQLADSCILAWVLLDTGACANAALLTNILGKGKVCFHSPKMYQNSPTAMQNSKILPRTIPRTLVYGG